MLLLTLQRAANVYRKSGSGSGSGSVVRLSHRRRLGGAIITVQTSPQLARLVAATLLLWVDTGNVTFTATRRNPGYARSETSAVDYLRIDSRFVQDLPDDPGDRDGGIDQQYRPSDQAQDRGEFAENDAVLDALRAIGVDYAQGYGPRRRPAPGTIISHSFPDKEACDETPDRQHSARSEPHDGRR